MNVVSVSSLPAKPTPRKVKPRKAKPLSEREVVGAVLENLLRCLRLDGEAMGDGAFEHATIKADGVIVISYGKADWDFRDVQEFAEWLVNASNFHGQQQLPASSHV